MQDFATTVLVVGFGAFALYGLYLMIMGQAPDQILDRDIRRLIARNKGKAPIVYLRSFAAEKFHVSDLSKAPFTGKTVPSTMAYTKNVGDVVTSMLRVIGPPIQLAAPEASFRFRGWAPSRPQEERVGNDAWQQKVLDWFSQASLVVVQLDASPGLMWELAELVRRVPPTKVLLVLPAIQSEYAELRASTAGRFPRPLPPALPNSRLMAFRPDWEPWPLAAWNGAEGFWRAVEPVFDQNQFEAPAWRRAFGYRERTGNSKGA